MDSSFRALTSLELPAAFDAHVHLRDGEMAQLVTPTIRQGGVSQVFVMVCVFVYMRMSVCVAVLVASSSGSQM